MQIDEKAILELAALGSEVKQYLKDKYPEVFNKTYYYNDVFGNCLIVTIGPINGYQIATTEEIQRYLPDYKPETL
jgi:hypothetical protein